MKKPVIIIGGGGHAKVLIDMLLLQKIKILGFTDLQEKELQVAGKKISYLGTDEAVLKNKNEPKKMYLVNGLGSIGDNTKRREVFNKFKAKGFSFLTVVHPSAIVSPDAVLSEGVQVMAAAVVQPGCKIGENTIVNTSTSVDHDCVIGAHVHLAPGVTLSGQVKVGDGSHIGTGAKVIQSRKIGKDCFIGAHQLVVDDKQDRSSQKRPFSMPENIEQ